MPEKGGRRVFRSLSSLEEAKEKLARFYTPQPFGVEQIALEKAYGRVLAEDVFSSIDVPGFDRASMDGYAVKAADTFGADEDRPVELKVVGSVRMGVKPTVEVELKEAAEIGTGAPMPRGANAVVMVEYTERRGSKLMIYRPVTPGENVISAGSDLMTGELVARKGCMITPREMGLLAAVGLKKVKVFRKPRVAIISTGNELVSPGETLDYGKIYDINAASISGLVLESGGEPVAVGVARDDRIEMESMLRKAFSQADCVVTSGSTSAGADDLMYRIIDGMGEPGIIVHGIAVKPGKPAIIAVVDGKPFFGLPGYPSSAMIIFTAVAQPVVRAMAGLGEDVSKSVVEARVAQKIFSEKGRREFLPVHIVQDEAGRYNVYPILSGSGAISSFGMADGFIDIPEERAFVSEDETVIVKLLTSAPTARDLIIIGSHCVGIDILISHIRTQDTQFNAKVVNVGSLGGLHAVKRGEADLAGIHLLDEAMGEYNTPFIDRYGLKDEAVLIKGYGREQGLILPKGNPKKIMEIKDILREDVVFLNRNQGSGTRILFDMLLGRYAQDAGLSFDEARSRVRGYDVEAKSHSAVAASVTHGRADVGVGIKTVAYHYGLDFTPLMDEKYDFLALRKRLEKPYVKRFFEALSSEEFKALLKVKAPGLSPDERTGCIIYP